MPWAAAEGSERVPVAGDGLMAPGCRGPAFADVIRPAHGELAGEQEDLLLMASQPGPEGVSGVVTVVQVPQPVVDDPRGDRSVVASVQVIEYLLVKGGVPAGGAASTA
jgi:hypothetical protein